MAKIANALFFLFALGKSRLFSRRKLTILFSKHDGLEPKIREGFRFTRHKITFAELSPENIKSHDLVVPLLTRDLIYLNEVGHLIVDNPLPVPSADSIALCEDKYLFNQAMISKGYAGFIPRMSGALTYPYILKKRIDDSSKHSYIISNSDQEQIFRDAISSPEYFCQEIIPGPREYATHILFINRNIANSINVEYVFDKDVPIKGKDNAIYTRICRCPFLEDFSSILAMLDFEGLCCFNYKVVGQRCFILEINPRFGGSLALFFFSFLERFD